MVDNTIKWSLLVYTRNIDKIAFSKHIFTEFECSLFCIGNSNHLNFLSFLHLFTKIVNLLKNNVIDVFCRAETVEQIQKLKYQFEFDRNQLNPERVKKTEKKYSLKIRDFCTVYLD